MIENLAVGPPIQGFPGTPLREAVRSPREDESGSFSRTLGDKIEPKVPKAAQAMEDRGRAPEKATRGREDGPPREIEPMTAKIPGQKRAEGAREKAIRKFMDSFESEFGIPPTRIVEAMASIEPQKMNETPEATVQDVISRLDLEPEDRERAMAMYAGLLAELQSADRSMPTPPVFMKTDAAVTAPQMQERFQTAHVQRANLNQSLDRLNEKFWMKDRFAQLMDAQNPFLAEKAMPDFSRVAMASESDDEITAADDESARLESLLRDDDGGIPRGFSEDEALEPQGPPAPAQGQSPAPARMKQVLSEMKRAADEAKRAEIEAKLEMMNGTRPDKGAVVAGAQASANDAVLANAARVEQSASSMTPAMTAKSAGERGASEQGFDSSSGRESKGDSGSSSSSSHQEFRLAQAATAPVPLKMEDVAAALKAAAPVTAAAMTMSPADNEANVRQLMNQAQYLIKKGGGEVKVVMNPEGLGQVQLKVLVEDGKVNVQMAAETKEAKNAIESSLPELRSSLAAHKLSVDHVKVDIVSGPNTDNQARNDMNSNLNQQQRDTRQFWNQFQENFGNRGQRDGFLDMPAMKEYRRAREPKPLEPSHLETTSVRKSEGKGRGLNLVA